MKIGSKKISVHRVAYTIFYEEDPGDKFICHTCDVQRCWNPFHLFKGDHQENMSDMVEKKRQAKGDRHGSSTHPEKLARGSRNGAYTHPEKTPRGSKHWKAMLTEDQVREVLSYKSQGCKSADIAIYMKLCISTVNNVYHGHSWKHIK
jgi:hypothetical protein